MRYFIIAFVIAVFASTVQAGGDVVYEAGAERYEGYFAEASDPEGLVLVIHDWDGLTGYERKRAEMLAELGYDAFAVDLYGKGNRPAETSAKKAETENLYNDREKMRSLILAGLSEGRRLRTTPW